MDERLLAVWVLALTGRNTEARECCWWKVKGKAEGRTTVARVQRRWLNITRKTQTAAALHSLPCQPAHTAALPRTAARYTPQWTAGNLHDSPLLFISTPYPQHCTLALHLSSPAKRSGGTLHGAGDQLDREADAVAERKAHSYQANIKHKLCQNTKNWYLVKMYPRFLTHPV